MNSPTAFSQAAAQSTSTTFTLTVTGDTTTNPGSLTLNASITNGTTTLTVSTIDSSYANIGNYFGYRTATASPAGITVNYDNLTIDTPEPASLAALALVGAGTLRRRRR